MNPEYPHPEIVETAPSMTEAETLAFLTEHNVTPLSVADYTEGQTVLYVMEQFTQGDDGPFKKLPTHMRPSIVRIDNPGKLDIEHPYKPNPDEPDQSRVVYDLHNPGNRVDYYSIDKQTQRATLVKTSYTKTDLESYPPVHPYKVRPENLFHSADQLFPKGA